MAIVRNTAEHRVPLTVGFLDAGEERNIDTAGAWEQQLITAGTLLIVDPDEVPPSPAEPFVQSPRKLFVASNEPTMERSDLWIDRDNFKLYERATDGSTDLVGELGGGSHRIVAGGNLGAAYTFATQGDQAVWLTGTLTHDLVLTLGGLVPGAVLTMILQQDATGGRSVTLSDDTVIPVSDEPSATAIITVYVLATDNLVIQVASSGGVAPTPDFDPLTLSPAFWYDPNQFSGLTDGAAIAAVEDASTNNRDLVQSDATKRPTKQTVNGHTVLRFDGSNDVLNGDANFTLVNSDLTLYVLVYGYTKTNYGTFVTLAPTTVLLRQNSTTGHLAAVFNAGGMSESVDRSGTTPFIACLRLPLGAPATLHVNGTLVATSSENVSNYGFDDYQIGGDVNSGVFLQGDLGDVLLFPTVHDSAQQANVEGLLKAKAGIA